MESIMDAVILEDEFIAAKRLKRLVRELEIGVTITHIFSSIAETAEYLENTDRIPDLLFLDIHVLDGNSLELFNVTDVRSKVIFTTAYDEYAVRAFRKNAIDYLLKPIKKEELLESILRAKPKQRSELPDLSEGKYKSRILVKFGQKIKSIACEDIAYIFSQHKISYIFTGDGNKTASNYKLQELEELLDPQKFFRLNRQFIAHIDSIQKISSHNAARLKIDLIPTINEEIIISTEKSKLFKAWLER